MRKRQPLKEIAIVKISHTVFTCQTQKNSESNLLESKEQIVKPDLWIIPSVLFGSNLKI